MDSRIIDVAIGLSLVFALTSLLAATLVEAFSSLIKLRGRVLKKAIVSFLADDTAFADSLQEHPLIVSLAPGLKGESSRKPSYIASDVIVTSLLSHLTMQFSGGVRPSSPAELVSNVAAGGIAASPPPTSPGQPPQPNDEFKKGLASLLMGVENDWPAYEQRLRAWYDSVTERSIGWYKRRTQLLLLGAGLMIAGLANINPIVIAPRLWNDAALREAMVSAGAEASKAYAASVAAAEPTAAAGTPAASDTAGAPATGTATDGSAGATPPAVRPPALVKPPAARIDASANTARDYAIFHYALLDAVEKAAKESGDQGSADRLRMLQEDAEIPDRLARMRTPEDGTMASVNARADAHAALDSSLRNLRELLGSNPAYKAAEDARAVLMKSIDGERDALGKAGAKRVRDCSTQEDPAARDLCLRLGDLAQLREMGLPIGWHGDVWPNYGEKDGEDGGDAATLINWLAVLGGWLLTAMATTLGAPFWFDALSKLAKLRGTGTKIDGTETSDAARKPTTLDTTASLTATGSTTAKEPMSDALNAAEKALSPMEIQRIQRGLGMTDQQLTGFFDANTRVAIQQWQTTQALQPTGELTPTQIQQLLGLGQAQDSDDYAG